MRYNISPEKENMGGRIRILIRPFFCAKASHQDTHLCGIPLLYLPGKIGLTELKYYMENIEKKIS